MQSADGAIGPIGMGEHGLVGKVRRDGSGYGHPVPAHNRGGGGELKYVVEAAPDLVSDQAQTWTAWHQVWWNTARSWPNEVWPSPAPLRRLLEP